MAGKSLTLADVNAMGAPAPAPTRSLTLADVNRIAEGEARRAGDLPQPETPDLGALFPGSPTPPAQPPRSDILSALTGIVAGTKTRLGFGAPRLVPGGALPGAYEDAIREQSEADALADYYGSTTRLGRVVAPLESGLRQAQQIAPALGATIASRSMETFDRARQPADVSGPQPRGAIFEAARRQSEDEAARSRAILGGKLADTLDDLTARVRQQRAIPENPASTGMQQADTWGEAARQFWRDPVGVVQAIGLQSLPVAVPGLVAGAAAGPATGATVLGGTAALQEYASTIVGELAKAGVDVTDRAAMREAFADSALMGRVRSAANTRAAIIGPVSAASMGMAGKTLAPAALSPLGRQAVNIPAQIAAQGAIGAGGEAGAQFATEGRIDQPGAIIGEAVGAAAGAPVEVGALAGGRALRSRLPEPPAPSRPVPPTIGPDPLAPAPAAESQGGAPGAPHPPLPRGPDAPPSAPSPAPPVEVPAAPPPMARPGTDTVLTPRGRRVEVEPVIVEADSLVTSHGDDLTRNPAFPTDLQPRERERAASQAQIAEMAGRLAPELLGRTPSATDGAPIIGPDGVVESGNARTLAIRRAYGQNAEAAAGYRAWLQGQGYDLSGFRNPVLVRRRLSILEPADRAAFVREANERTTAAMSATETARADARNIPDPLLEQYRGGDLNAGINRDFVRRWMDTVSPAERGALIDADGALSQTGRDRLSNAIFARAWEAPDLLASLREATETNIKAIGEGMTDAAPAWARMRAGMARGDLNPAMDATRSILDAVRLVQRARTEGRPILSLTRQGDMLGGGTTPETMAALRLLFSDPDFRRPVSRQRVGEALRWVASQAEQSKAGPGLFGAMQGPALVDLLTLARNRGMGDLLPDAAEMRAPRQGAQQRLTLEQANRAIQSELPPVAEAQQNMTPGANYTPFRRDAENAGASPAKDPIRRNRIVADLTKALDAALYTGRIKGNATLGFYRRPVEEVRIKRANDIETTTHEIAHLLDDRIPEIRQQWTPASNANAMIRAELRGVSYDATKLYEGFAEFVRLWGTQRDQALAKAPTFYAWFEGFLDRSPKIGAALRKAQADMHAWFEQSALDRARSKIGGENIINKFLDAPLDRFRQSVLDDLHGIARAERELTGALQPGGAYETARLLRGSAALIEGALLYGAPKVEADGSHSFVGKGLKEILRPVGAHLDDFLLYAVGRSARELNTQGRERLFTNVEIRAMLKLERPEFKRAFKDYQAWNGAILDFAEAKGLIDPLYRASWQRTDYLPFHRIGQPGIGEGAPGEWRGIKALTGGTENIRPVLQNIMQNAATLIDASLKNEVRAKVADLVGSQGGAKFMAKIPREDRVIKVHAAEVERAILDALGVRNKHALPIDQQVWVDQIIGQMRPMAEFLLRGQAPMGGRIVAVLRGGRPEYYEVADPIMYRALTALTRPAQNWLVGLLAAPRRIGQASVTLTADFMAANFVRDAVMGGIMSRYGFRPFYDSARGMLSRITSDPAYREFIANGGGFSSQLRDEPAFRRRLERFYQSKGIDFRTVLHTPARALEAAERVADAFETATRLGEYKRARAAGADPRHAAYAAREVSTDFAMRGDSAAIGFLYDTILFLKAGVNSLDRMYRGISQDPNKHLIAAKVAMLALASTGLYALNRGNPLYEQMEDWEKDAFWHFFVPRPEALRAEADGQPMPLDKGYLHFRMPKLWEVGAVSSLAERATAAALDGLDGPSALAMLKTIGGVFNFDYVPHAVEPLYELAINRERFTNRPITPQSLGELEPWARAMPNTSMTLRRLGEATRGLPRGMQLSPVEAEHLLRGYFNTWAMYGLTMIDAAAFDDQKPDARTDQLPVVRRFFRQEPAASTKPLRELYDAINAANEVRATMRQMDKTYRPEIAGEMESRPENLMHRQLSRAEEGLRVFTRETAQIINAPDLATVRKIAGERALALRDSRLVTGAKTSGAWEDAGALKRLLIDDLTRERNAMAGKIMSDVKARRAEIGAGNAR